MNVQIACPKCGRKRELALAEMSAGSALACEGCGALIRFKGAGAKVNMRVGVKPRRPWWKFWGA